jgi:transcriptional regulator with XRE-family HTH domain
MPLVFDFSELRGRIIAGYGSYAAFAESIGMARALLSARLNNKVHFSPDDIVNICSVLNIPADKIGNYFFTPKV